MSVRYKRKVIYIIYIDITLSLRILRVSNLPFEPFQSTSPPFVCRQKNLPSYNRSYYYQNISNKEIKIESDPNKFLYPNRAILGLVLVQVGPRFVIEVLKRTLNTHFENLFFSSEKWVVRGRLFRLYSVLIHTNLSHFLKIPRELKGLLQYLFLPSLLKSVSTFPPHSVFKLEKKIFLVQTIFVRFQGR